MNRDRRDLLKSALASLGGVIGIVERVKDDEQDSADNMPENLQLSDRYADMENAIEHLEDALENLNEASDCIGKAMR